MNNRIATLIARIEASAGRLAGAEKLLAKATNGGESREGLRFLRREVWLLTRLAMRLWVAMLTRSLLRRKRHDR